MDQPTIYAAPEEDSICRLCLKCCTGETQSWSLFHDDLHHKLMAFVAIQVQEHDGLPRIICTNCRNLLHTSYDFKCQVEKSDRDLRQVFLIRESTTQWPTVPKSIEHTLETTIACFQKNIINSSMTIQNEHSINDDKQLISEIENGSSNENEFCKKEELLVSKNNSVSNECIAENHKNISFQPNNIQQNEDNRENVDIEFEAQIELKNLSLNLNKVKKSESTNDRQNSNQSDDEKPLILRTKRHKCNYCIKSFANLSLLEKHAIIHKKHLELIYICHLCNEQFASVEKVKCHVLTYHGMNIDREKLLQNSNSMTQISKSIKEIVNNNDEYNTSKKDSELKKKLVCKFCWRQFTYHRPFITHIKTHSDSNNKLFNKVNKNQAEEATFQSNIKKDTDDNTNVRDLPFRESTNESEDEDDSNHDIATPCRIQCNQCGKLVATQRNLERHLLTHSSLRHTCSKCGKDFSRPDKLLEHQQLKHKIELDCLPVGNKLVNNRTMEADKIQGRNSRPHKCSLCPKAFAQAQSLVNHEERHKRVQDVRKRFLCDVCSKCFAQSGSLVAHMRTHTGVKPYVCKVCSRAFTKSTYLQLHLRTHSGEKPYICHYCSRAFARANTLARHLTVHTGEAKYQCQICTKSFRRLTSLNEHTYTHTGQRPYACKICSKRYNNAGSLYAHTKKCKALQAAANSNCSTSLLTTDNNVGSQSDFTVSPRDLVFEDQELDETIIYGSQTTVPSTCQFMIVNVNSSEPTLTSTIEQFAIQESDIYNSKQFKGSYYGLYPSM